MANAHSLSLLALPSEILVHILRSLTTPSFIQTILICHQLFDLAAASRDVVLHHLRQMPGIKLGLEDQILTTSSLFLILRQRAASSLYGANFHADCEDLGFQNGTLDATASCLADSTGGINISLVMNESHVVRHYSSGGTIESHTPPYVHGDGKPVQVVHWKGTTSILYERLAPLTAPCGQCNEGSSFHPDGGEGGPPNEKVIDPVTAKNYYLVHHKSHMNDRPDLFHIPTPNGVLPKLRGEATRSLVPLGLTIHNRLKCAILWGEAMKSGSSVSTCYVVNSKSSTTQVILYTCDRLPAPLDEASDLEAVVLYPIQRPSIVDEASPTPSALDRNIEYLSQYRPRSIGFVEGGRHLKLYRAGSIAPYAILPSTVATSRGGLRSHDRPFSRLRNDVHIGLNTFKIETPFFGQHTFDSSRHSGDEQQPRECLNVYLHLAASRTGFLPNYASDAGQSDLYIVQNRMTTEEDDCEHVIDLDDTGRVPYDELRVVARLWGWNSSLLSNSTLTATDALRVSSKGTRIAIACWDRILVWPLHPEIFCEAWVAEERNGSETDEVSVVSDDSTPVNPPIVPPGVIVGNGQADNDDDETSDTVSSVSDSDDDTPTQPAMVKATKFYDLVKHPSFGEIVELRPIVLKLPGGAIARKLMWSSAVKECFDESTIEDSDVIAHMGSYDADRRSVRSSEGEIEHGSSVPEARRPGDLEGDTNIPVRLTEEDHPNHGPSITAEEKGELDFIGAELETLVEDNLRLETSIPPAALGLGDSRPANLRYRKLDGEAAKAGIEPPSPVEHELPNAGMNDAPQTLTALNRAVQETGFLQRPPDGKQVQLYVQDLRPSEDVDEDQNSGLNSTTVDNTNVLEDFDFDTFLSTTNENPFIFDPTGSTQETRSAATDLPPAPYDLDSRPPSHLENRNASWRKSERRREKLRRERKPKRDAEDELVVLTDRGLQVWNLGVWAKGRRQRGYLEEKLP